MKTIIRSLLAILFGAGCFAGYALFENWLMTASSVWLIIASPLLLALAIGLATVFEDIGTQPKKESND